jgi:hypothetical protein
MWRLRQTMRGAMTRNFAEKTFAIMSKSPSLWLILSAQSSGGAGKRGEDRDIARAAEQDAASFGKPSLSKGFQKCGHEPRVANWRSVAQDG